MRWEIEGGGRSRGESRGEVNRGGNEGEGGVYHPAARSGLEKMIIEEGRTAEQRISPGEMPDPRSPSQIREEKVTLLQRAA